MKMARIFPILICNLLYASSNEVETPQNLNQYKQLNKQQKKPYANAQNLSRLMLRIATQHIYCVTTNCASYYTPSQK